MNTTAFQVAFVALGLMYPDVKITPAIALAQAVHESANFTSHNWEVNNNCFGMTPPMSRQTTCTNKGTADRYAHYDDVLACLRDYYLYCQAFGLLNDAQLDDFLKNGKKIGDKLVKYATDPAYYKRVQAVAASLRAKDAYISKEAILGTGIVTAGGVTLAAVYAVAHILKA